MEDKELKPCPFCGGVAKLSHGYEHMGMDGSIPIAFVHCTKCGCKSRNVFLVNFYYTNAKTDEDAINIWNERYNNG